MKLKNKLAPYRGRLAPSPTGYLHVGHAYAFWHAYQRCVAAKGSLVYREEDLDQARCQPEYAQAARQDLSQLGLKWQEGPQIGGPHAPYKQSERRNIYQEYLSKLKKTGLIYPSRHSRQKISQTTKEYAPNGEPIFPRSLRPEKEALQQILRLPNIEQATQASNIDFNLNWRFRVPPNRRIQFSDQKQGPCSFQSQIDFGDFLVWRKAGIPSYEFAVVIDDYLMQITEVVRGADLLLSTARQLLLYEALELGPPTWYHCDLIKDSAGRKLSKRNGDQGLTALLEKKGAAFLRASFT